MGTDGEMKKGSENREEIDRLRRTEEAAGGERDVSYLAGCVVITLIAAFLRFYQLAMRPLHHDEGVNGHFLTKLFREGVYKYDPSNYHGPDLYYLSLAFSKIFGLNTWSVRSSVALFGVLTVVLAFFLRRHLGRVGSLAAAFFLAVSPGMVYISRYFIHEILFVFFSLSLVVAVLFFMEKRRAGPLASVWMVLLLLVSFLPTALSLADLVGGESGSMVWLLRILILAVEGVLIFYVMRMLHGWNEGRPIYLMLAAASLIFLFATKETAFITVGTMLIACVAVRLWEKLAASEFYRANRFRVLAGAQLAAAAVLGALAFGYGAKEFLVELYGRFTGPNAPDQTYLFFAIGLLGVLTLTVYVLYFLGHRSDDGAAAAPDGETELGSADAPETEGPGWKDFREGLGTGADLLLIVVASAVVFIYVGVLFFSSFFTYPDGVKGAFEAYAIWSKTGSKDHTQNGWAAYLKWMLQIEAPLVFLSVAGTLIAFVKARHRFAMFAGLWAFGLFLAYTIIPYKTPWLALSFTLPMCLIAGYAVDRLWDTRDRLRKTLTGVTAGLAALVLLFQTYDLNFVRYDSDRLPYVYAHTQRGFHDLIAEIERYAARSGKGTGATVEIVSNEYWPMPWYLNDYPKANFHGRLIDASTAEMIVASKTQFAELTSRYGARYKHAGTYPLRPGVELYLLVRRDLAGPDTREIYVETGVPR